MIKIVSSTDFTILKLKNSFNFINSKKKDYKESYNYSNNYLDKQSLNTSMDLMPEWLTSG